MKKRIDQMLVEAGHASSRNKAQALVSSGYVRVNGQQVAKPGQQFAADCQIEVTGQDHPWVGRGGMKLDGAIQQFGIDPSGAVAMDIGSSTGGFTQVLLHYGAAHVFAVDVGTDQLHPSLRSDGQITLLEQTNARDLTAELIDRPCNWIVCDASFISLKKVLEVPFHLAAKECQLVALVKPQFELARQEVGKGGIVRDPALHSKACEQISAWLKSEAWQIQGFIDSPITGTGGNKEFLVSAVRG